MSIEGLPAAFIFIAAFMGFCAAIIAFDFWLEKRYGDSKTITYGVRWLIRHVPLLTHLLVLLFGMLVGGLMVHFAGDLFSP